MSKIEELRNSEKNQLNLIKVLERIFPEKKTKYYELISRFIDEDFDTSLNRENNIKKLRKYNTEGLNDLEKMFILLFIPKIMSKEEIEQFEYFCQKHDSNVIKADLQTLKYEEISELCDESRNSEELKRLQSQNIKLYEDDEWLVLLPLSHECSVKYGYGTKWCTASEDSDANFRTYISDGVLVYIINRKTNVKHAIYQEKDKTNDSSSNITLWDAEDNCIEIFFTDLPEKILSVIKKFLIENVETNNEMCYRLYYQDESSEEEENVYEIEIDEKEDDDDDFFDIDEEREQIGRNDIETQGFIDMSGRRVEVSEQSSDYRYQSVYGGYTSPFWRAVQRLNKD